MLLVLLRPLSTSELLSSTNGPDSQSCWIVPHQTHPQRYLAHSSQHLWQLLALLLLLLALLLSQLVSKAAHSAAAGAQRAGQHLRVTWQQCKRHRPKAWGMQNGWHGVQSRMWLMHLHRLCCVCCSSSCCRHWLSRGLQETAVCLVMRNGSSCCSCCPHVTEQHCRALCMRSSQYLATLGLQQRQQQRQEAEMVALLLCLQVHCQVLCFRALCSTTSSC